jgi:hypothetical protein
MDFRDFTIKLALGELSNTALVDETDQTSIRQGHRAKVLTALNQGLKALHSRFILIQKEILIQGSIGVSHYFIRKEFATTNDAVVPFKYLLDSAANPFVEDIVKILQVYNSMGDAQYLNDIEQEDSLFTSEFDCLQIPRNRGQIYSVIYQAMHPEMIGTDPCQEIHLPHYLEEALISYVAGKVFQAQLGEESTMKGQELMANYTNICAEIEMRDLVSNSVTTTNTKLEMRGFI